MPCRISFVLIRSADKGHMSFPFDETVQTLVYGAADENGQIGPYLTKDSERDELLTELLVPEI